MSETNLQESLPARKQRLYRATNCEHTVRIDISDDMASYSAEELKRMDDMFTLEFQGDKLETNLWESLPGATYDALFAAMAKRKASQLKVTND